MHFMKKSDSDLDKFSHVQNFFFESLKRGHVKLIDDLLPLMMEGFEWTKSFKIEKTSELKHLVHPAFDIPESNINQSTSPSFRYLVKEIIKKFFPR